VPLLQRFVGDAVAQLARELLQRLQRPCEAVALDLGDRRIQRRRLGWWRQRIDLRGAEDSLQAKVCARPVGGYGAGVPPACSFFLEGGQGTGGAPINNLVE